MKIAFLVMMMIIKIAPLEDTTQMMKIAVPRMNTACNARYMMELEETENGII